MTCHCKACTDIRVWTKSMTADVLTHVLVHALTFSLSLSQPQKSWSSIDQHPGQRADAGRPADIQQAHEEEDGDWGGTEIRRGGVVRGATGCCSDPLQLDTLETVLLSFFYTFVLTGAACSVWGFWEKFLSAALSTFSANIITCLFHSVHISVYYSCLVICITAENHFLFFFFCFYFLPETEPGILSDHNLSRRFLLPWNWDLATAGAPLMLQPTACFHFYIIYPFEFVQCTVCFLFCFSSSAKRHKLGRHCLNPSFFSSHIFVLNWWVLPKTLNTLVCCPCLLHCKGTRVCMRYFHNMFTLRF